MSRTNRNKHPHCDNPKAGRDGTGRPWWRDETNSRRALCSWQCITKGYKTMTSRVLRRRIKNQLNKDL